jgi:hypothetical protein
MGYDAARTILWIAGAYLGIGSIVTVPLVLSGIGRIDPAAKAAPWSFRVLVVPGVVAFWPLLLRRWIAARRQS